MRPTKRATFNPEFMNQNMVSLSLSTSERKLTRENAGRSVANSMVLETMGN